MQKSLKECSLIWWTKTKWQQIFVRRGYHWPLPYCDYCSYYHSTQLSRNHAIIIIVKPNAYILASSPVRLWLPPRIRYEYWSFSIRMRNMVESSSFLIKLVRYISQFVRFSISHDVQKIEKTSLFVFNRLKNRFQY